MNYRVMGRAGLRIPEIGLGSWELGESTYRRSLPDGSIVIDGSSNRIVLSETLAVSDRPDLHPLDLGRVSRLHGNVSTVLA